MSWLDDLQELMDNANERVNGTIGGVAEYIPGLASVDNIVHGDWGGAVGDIPGSFGKLMDVPRQLVAHEAVGGTIGSTAWALNNLGLNVLPDQENLAREWQTSGGTGVWENQLIDDAPWYVKAPLDIALDPMTYLAAPVKLAGKATNLSKLGAMGVKAGVEGHAGAARALNAADFVFNKAPGAIVGKPAEYVARKVKGGITRINPALLDLAPEDQLMRDRTNAQQAFMEKLAARGDNQNTSLATLSQNVPSPHLNVAPIDAYDIPPFMDRPFESGVPAAVRERAYEAFGRLRAAQKDSDQGGTLPLTQRLRGSFERWKQRKQQLGIVANPQRSDGEYAIPSRGFRSPANVPADEQMFDDMAAIGVATLLNNYQRNRGQVFSQLSVASTGMRDVRSAIVNQYGPGMEPYLPYIHGKMREQLGQIGKADILPHSRFSLQWGWPEDTIPEGRLKTVRDAMTNGMSREDALRQATYQKLTPGTPEVVEGAAAYGAGILESTRAGDIDISDAYRPGGQFYTGQINPETKRALVPDEFGQMVMGDAVGPQGTTYTPGTIGSTAQTNRDLYNQYMRQMFGNLADDELDALREASVEILYHESINAAGQKSGGGQGATALFQGRPATGDPGNKISLYPKRPTDIGNQYIQGDTNVDAVGRIKFGDMEERYREATGANFTKTEWRRLFPGEEPPKKFSEDDKLRMMEKVGAKIITANPTGGMLASTQRIIQSINDGWDLKVGFGKANDWYENGAKEIESIVGPGNYDSAIMLIEFIGITSAGTSVDKNAERGLRAWAEWMLGNEKGMQEALGLTPEQTDRLLKTNVFLGEMTKPTPKAIKAGAVPEPVIRKNIFRQGIGSPVIDRAFNEYARRVDPNENLAFDMIQGGPKTNNYSGSFIINLWKDGVDQAIPPGKMRDDIQKALDDAAMIWTVDRHDNRLDNLATGVSDIGMLANRERKLIAAKLVERDGKTGIRGERGQSAVWYWAKDRQGFSREGRNDDIAVALRRAWDEAAEPINMATVREQLTQKYPDMGEDELRILANDLMRQEVALNLLKKELNKYSDKLTEIFGGDDVPEALMNLQSDTLSVFNRALSGAAPGDNPRNFSGLTDAVRKAIGATGTVGISGRSFSSGAGRPNFDVSRQAGQLVGQIGRGEEVGKTFGWVNGRWDAVQPTQGFAVAITSLPGDLDPQKPLEAEKKIRNWLANHTEILNDPVVAENLHFGVFGGMDSGKASFDLVAVVPDQQAAIDLGRKANQQSIWDFARGEEVITGGNGKSPIKHPEDIVRAFHDVFGDADTNPSTSLRQAIVKGITIDEMDAANPISLFNRKVVRPIVRAMQDRAVNEADDDAYQSALEAAAKKAGGQINDPGLMPNAIDETEPFDFASIGHDPLVSTQGNLTLGQTFSDGSTWGDRMMQYHDEAANDIAALEDAQVFWNPNSTLEDRLRMADGQPELQKMIRKYDKEGIDPLHGTPEDIAMNRFTNDLAEERGINHDRSTTMDLLRAAWGEQALLSPKYHTGNIQGAWIQNALTGTTRIGSPSEFLAAFKIARGGLDGVTKQEALHSLHAYQVAKKWGAGELPPDIFKGGVRSMTQTGRRSSSSAMGELAARVTKSRRVGQIVGKPFEINNDFGQGVETVLRGAKWSDSLELHMTTNIRRFEDGVAEMARKQGLPQFEFSIADNINRPQGELNPVSIKVQLMKMGFDDGHAERAGRNYAELLNSAKSFARAETNRVQFSYEKTNLDRAVGKIVPFHYWYSRALRFYGEEALRHPVLIENYMRMQEGVDRAQDDPGLSARQKGFLRLMSTPTGYSILMNPDSLFGVVKVFGLDDNFTPEGETEAGHLIQWLKDRGIGLYPWIDGALNMAGLYGDTFDPDLLGIRHRALIGSAVNFMRAQLGMEPGEATYSHAMNQTRANVSRFVASFTPDWLSQPVPPKAGGSQSEATMDTLIESRVLASNPNLTNGDLLDIMSDPDSPEYQNAYRQVADAGLAQQLLNFTLPQSFRVRDATRDVRNAQVSTIYEAAQKQGVSPYDFKPTEGDVSFASTYQKQTGKQWKPGDYEQAKIKNDLIRATPEAKPFLVADYEYRKLGTPDQQKAFETYQSLMYGDDPRTATMNDAARREVANAWADKTGNVQSINDVYDLRSAFQVTHPEFKQFKDWQSQMYTLKTNMGGSLAEYRRQAAKQNPNAAKYFVDTIKWIKETFNPDEWEVKLDDYTTSADAWFAITGQSQFRNDPAPLPGSPPPGIDPTQANIISQQTELPQPTRQLPDWVNEFNAINNSAGSTYQTGWNQV